MHYIDDCDSTQVVDANACDFYSSYIGFIYSQRKSMFFMLIISTLLRVYSINVQKVIVTPKLCTISSITTRLISA